MTEFRRIYKCFKSKPFFVPMRLACLGEHDWENICVGSEPDAWVNGFDKTLITTGNNLKLT